MRAPGARVRRGQQDGGGQPRHDIWFGAHLAGPKRSPESCPGSRHVQQQLNNYTNFTKQTWDSE